MTHSTTVAAFRAEMKWTLARMGEAVGLSTSQMHEVERLNRASLRVALAIEVLSEGRIDAAALNDDVRAARHGVDNGLPEACPATGQVRAVSGEVAA